MAALKVGIIGLGGIAHSHCESIAHLDDVTFTGDDQQIMNAQTGKGLIVRVFSDLELGLLEDLGYRVVMPQAPPYGMALIGLVFLARPRRKDKSAAR